MPLDFEDESIEQFGATRLEDLGWSQIMDAYACIMCNRCQDACPAYTTGKVLSPAALEINKRYFINQEAKALAAGQPSSQTLLEFCHQRGSRLRLHRLRRLHRHLPGGQRPDARYPRYPPRPGADGKQASPSTWQAAFRGMERSVQSRGTCRPASA